MQLKTLDWLRENELPTGGIRGWDGMDTAYPEVVGYLIPTLFDYGERDLACRCADWLLTVQHESGGYCSLDGILHTFDTAAIVEGLERAYQETSRAQYEVAAIKARDWIETMRTPDRLYRAGPGLGAPQHNIRVNGIVEVDPGYYSINTDDRTHFIAYALEGYLNLDFIDQVRRTLQSLPIQETWELVPFYWQSGKGADIIATAQMAILMMRVGMDASRLVDGVRRWVHPNGGVPQAPADPSEKSWGAKFYLDMERMVENGK